MLSLFDEKGQGYILNKCYYCESENTTYCSLCENWFCDDCRRRYDKRIMSMIKEKFKKMGKLWFSQDEVNEMKRKGEW